ncbi:Glutamyl-tRNA synthetase [Venustampulla echinocandica]|uniref:Glutamate--tRNA ligase, mitochondrial n=1 Tax=Venustampulla echinocandica TaxID=2656787 RepID=A0A370TVH4_9HELO|nr:Glutamyl-tRNA synthetase [Venustampulla echinocandica]RDL39509.1 Glutamyl-tRNA synthetase [Venustampulla echinocandica]
MVATVRLLLSSANRTRASRWICHSCRGIKHASTSTGKSALSDASGDLRNLGPARTRFAPSPTGSLHLGSLRTALFNYLIAKATGGQFLLRIEDTDQKRTIPGAEEKLFNDLEWACIQWDEGPKVGGPFGPYKQSERTEIYRKSSDELLRSGAAYRCFCSPERLHELAEYRNKLGHAPDYDRKCTHIPKEESDDRAAKGETHVVRLKMPDVDEGYTDLVYGFVWRRSDPKLKARFSTLGSFDDPILLKTDGFPTYHLANVVDDHLMEISHVIRGSEWMSSTPKHIALYKAFGWQPPAFAHVSLLVDTNKQKLSKRTGSVDIGAWRDMGIFPETLANFVALLGWSHRNDKDIMGMEDLIRSASMKFTKGDTIVSFEKLWFLQKHHAQRYAPMAKLSGPIDPRHDLNKLAVLPCIKLLETHKAGQKPSFYESLPAGERREDFVRSLLCQDARNYTTPIDFVNRNEYFFIAPSKEDLVGSLSALELHGLPGGTSPQVSPELLDEFDRFAQIESSKWDTTLEIKVMTHNIVDGASSKSAAELGGEEQSTELAIACRKRWSTLVHKYIRWALASGKPGPNSAMTMGILGKEETMRRLAAAKEIILSAEEHVGTQDVDSGSSSPKQHATAQGPAMSE